MENNKLKVKDLVNIGIFFGTVYGDLNDCYDSRWNCTNSMVDLARYCGAFRRSIFTLLMTKVRSKAQH